MSRRPPKFPLIRMVEWVEKNRVVLFFSSGQVSEVTLPCRSAKRAKILDGGGALDIGDGCDMGSDTLATMGKVIEPARRGWVGLTRDPYHCHEVIVPKGSHLQRARTKK